MLGRYKFKSRCQFEYLGVFFYKGRFRRHNSGMRLLSCLLLESCNKFVTQLFPVTFSEATYHLSIWHCLKPREDQGTCVNTLIFYCQTNTTFSVSYTIEIKLVELKEDYHLHKTAHVVDCTFTFFFFSPLISDHHLCMTIESVFFPVVS